MDRLLDISVFTIRIGLPVVFKMAASKVEKDGLRRKSSVKNSLANPYVLTWPTIEKSVYYSIINELRRKFPTILSRKSISKPRRKQLSVGEDAMTKEDRILLQQMKEKQEIRKCLAVGINEVTRGLESDELKLVLACRSVKPSTMTDHLMLLGATRQVPTLGLHDLGEVLGPLLQCRKVAALGFKKQQKESVFDSVVEFITPLVPDINVPWLKPFEETEQAQEKKSSDKELTMEGHFNKDSKQAGLKRRHSEDNVTAEDRDVNKKEAGFKRKHSEDNVTAEDRDVNKKQKVEEKDKENKTNIVNRRGEFQEDKEEENPQTNTAKSGSKIDSKKEQKKEDLHVENTSQKDRKTPKHENELVKVKVSFEPVVIKQNVPNLKKQGKRKKGKSKTK